MTTTRKLLVSLFLSVHLGAYAIRISPLGLVAQQIAVGTGEHGLDLYQLASSYQAYTVTSVSGQLFAPLPARSNVHIGAVAELADGSQARFRFPMPSDTRGLGAKRYEYFHKLGTSLSDGANAAFHPDVARYVARTLAAEGKRPLRVRLVAFHAEIPRHNRPEVYLAKQQQWFDYTHLLREAARYEETLLLDYAVRPEDIA